MGEIEKVRTILAGLTTFKNRLQQAEVLIEHAIM
jgi:hypothetical protein